MHIEFALHHYLGDNGDGVLDEARTALGPADYAEFVDSEQAAVVVNPESLTPVGVRWNNDGGLRTRLFR